MKTSRLNKLLLLVSVCGIVFAGNYAQYQVSALAFRVVPELGLTSAQFSAVLMAPYLPAAFLSIPIGAHADKAGAKGVVLACAVASCAASFARIEIGSFSAMFLACAVLGMAPCAMNATALKVLGTVFGDGTDRAMGWFYAAGSAGIAASLATSAMFSTNGAAYVFAAAMFAVFGVLWTVCAPAPTQSPCDVMGQDARSEEGALLASSRKSFADAARIPEVWLVALVLGVGMASATAYSGYLVSVYEGVLDPVAAGSMASVVTLGSILGSVVGPYMRSGFKDYRAFVAGCSVIGGALMLAGQLTASSPNVVLLALIGIFTAAAGPVLQALPYLLPQIGSLRAGSAGGIVSTGSLALTFLIPVVLSAALGDDYGLLLVGCAILFALGALAAPIFPGPDDLNERE